MKVPLNLAFEAKRTCAILTTVMLVLVALHVLAMQANFNDSFGVKKSLGFEYWQVAIFDLDEEESFGTWFSTLILLFASVLFFRLASIHRASADRIHAWWFVLGLGLCLMSVDEVVGLHEMINTIYGGSIWRNMSLGILLVVTVGFIPFLWRYRWRTSGLFLLSAAVFVTGAIGLEQYSGNQLNSLRYNMLTGLEETLEMSGVILAIYTALDFMEKQGSARNGSNYPDT